MTRAGLPALRDDEGLVLLRVAREAITARLLKHPAPDPGRVPARLLVHQGAFVSLHREVTLRGCIGVILPREPLVLTVQHCAVSAAVGDPRFPPLDVSELDDVSIDVSVLSTPVRVRDAGGIVPGTHGLIVTRGSRRGLLLPQVARDQGWDVGTFLAETCRKAGLPPDAWERGAAIEVFEAEVFSESRRGSGPAQHRTGP